MGRGPSAEYTIEIFEVYKKCALCMEVAVQLCLHFLSGIVSRGKNRKETSNICNIVQQFS